MDLYQSMKKDIHPQVYTDTIVTCACGNTFVTTSTLKNISVEICSACHPFFTGQQKFIDTEGRIDKFAKKMKLAEEKKQQASKTKKAMKKIAAKGGKKASLKELLEHSKESQR